MATAAPHQPPHQPPPSLSKLPVTAVDFSTPIILIPLFFSLP